MPLGTGGRLRGAAEALRGIGGTFLAAAELRSSPARELISPVGSLLEVVVHRLVESQETLWRKDALAERPDLL